MEDIIASIIEAKVQIAQTEEQTSQRTRVLKEMYEKISASDYKINDLNREISSLLKSINEIIAEKNSYRGLFEQNKENTEDCRSPDQFLEIRTEVDGIELWNRILLETENGQSLKKIKNLSKRGIPTKIRGEV